MPTAQRAGWNDRSDRRFAVAKGVVKNERRRRLRFSIVLGAPDPPLACSRAWTL